MIDTIVKRDGREMPFESDKIAQAVRKAFEATGQNKDEKTCAKIAHVYCPFWRAGIARRIALTFERCLLSGLARVSATVPDAVYLSLIHIYKIWENIRSLHALHNGSAHIFGEKCRRV